MSPRVLRTLAIVLLIAANIGCDQVSKAIARKEISRGERIEVIGDNLVLTKVENTGAFLGMGSGLPQWLKNILLLGLPAVVMTGLFVYLLTKTTLSRTTIVALSFIVGGGIGNLYDRILYGQVTDFLFMDFEIFHTGIFNMADVSVMVGTGLILVESFFSKKPRKAPAAETPESPETPNTSEA